MDRLSSAPTDCRVPDPTDAKADGGFGNHRAGYSRDRLAQAEHWARKGGTLAAGEGLVLCAEIDRLRGELELVSSEAAEAYHAIDRRDEELAQQSITLSAEHQRAERILAALREPSWAVTAAADDAMDAASALDCVPGDWSRSWVQDAIRAAVKAAEKETSTETTNA